MNNLKNFCFQFRLSDRWIILFLVLYTLGIVAQLSWSSNTRLYTTIDDGYYYLKIAQYLAAGEGSTFDGLNQTNGYHPLWLLILVLVAKLTPDTSSAHLSSYLLQGVFMTIGVVLLYRTIRLRYAQLASLLVSLFWLGSTYWLSIMGLEFSLHALGLFAIGYVYLRYFADGLPQQASPYWALAILLSLTFLARLETMLLAILLIFFVAKDQWQVGFTPQRVRHLFILSLPVLLTGLAYGLTNLLLFDHLAPVSGVVKRDWSAYYLSQDPIYQNYGYWVAKGKQLFRAIPFFLTLPAGYLILLGIFGVIGGWGLSLLKYCPRPVRKWLKNTLRSWPPFILFSLLTFLSYGFLYHRTFSYAHWYYVVQMWLALLLVSALLDAFLKNKPSTTSVGLLGRFVLVVAILWQCIYIPTRIESKRPNDNLGPVLSVISDLPANAIIGSWNAGAISYLSGRQVVNLDGLVNSWDYYLSHHFDLCRYWDEVGITHLVDVFKQNDKMMPIPKVPNVPTYQSYEQCVERLEFVWADERPEYAGHNFQLYRLR